MTTLAVTPHPPPPSHPNARPQQVQGFVVVTRCTQRTFGVKEWGALRDQLASWRESLHGATQLLGSMHASAAAGPVGMAGRPAISAAI